MLQKAIQPTEAGKTDSEKTPSSDVDLCQLGSE
jgi:hypothetical protein